MQIVTIPVGILSTNCYLVIDERRGKAACIYPGGEPERILGALSEAGADLAAILLTHGHSDHIGGVTGLAKRTGAPVYVHPDDVPLLADVEGEFSDLLPSDYEPPPLVEALADRAKITVGDIEFTVLHTPGHSLGSCSFLAEGHLFCGDLLFAGSVGRTDLAGGDTRTLIRSLIEKVMPLPEGTVVHPGHGPATTVGEEKATNPFLQLERLQWQG